jgi:hypothetical protein
VSSKLSNKTKGFMLLQLQHHRLFTWDSEEKNSQHLLLLLLLTTLQKLQMWTEQHDTKPDCMELSSKR